MTRLNCRTWLGLMLALAPGCSGAELNDSTLTQEVTQAGVTSTLGVDNDWGSGFCATVTLQNNSSNPATNWAVVMNSGGSVVNNLWNGSYTQSGSTVTVEPASYNAVINPASSASFGFCANGAGRPTVTSVSSTGGTTSTGVCSATYEAESSAVQKATGGELYSSEGWNIWSEGHVHTNHDFVAGGNATTMVTKGDQFQGAPTMVISVDGEQVGSIDVPVTTWTAYTFDYGASSSGSREIRVAFANDRYEVGVGDRNLHVDAILVRCDSNTGSGGSGGGVAGSCGRAVGSCTSPQVSINEIDVGVSVTGYGNEWDTAPLPIAARPSGGSLLAWLGTNNQVYVGELDCDDNLVGTPFSFPWWYQHHGRLAFDGSNYAAYFCIGITVNNDSRHLLSSGRHVLCAGEGKLGRSRAQEEYAQSASSVTHSAPRRHHEVAADPQRIQVVDCYQCSAAGGAVPAAGHRWRKVRGGFLGCRGHAYRGSGWPGASAASLG